MFGKYVYNSTDFSCKPAVFTLILFYLQLNGTDNIPFTTLSYANGPGYRPEISNERFNLAYDDIRK